MIALPSEFNQRLLLQYILVPLWTMRKAWIHVVTEGIELWDVSIVVAMHTLGAVQLHLKLRKFLHA